MKTDITEIQAILIGILNAQAPPLKVRSNSIMGFEVAGTKETMQGKQKVDRMYFASIVPKPKDVRLYFFPIYTHPHKFDLSTELKKYLKGKSCFHIKKLDDALETEIKAMVAKGIEIFRQENWV